MNKVVLITGASSGIGKEIAKIFLKKNYNLILSGRKKGGFEDFKESQNVDIVIGDITKSETREKFVELVKNKYRKLDILINNAGITFIQPFEKNSEEQLNEIVETNLKSHILLTHNLYSIMKTQKFGTIVFINSSAGKQGYENHTLYSATKFGLTGFAQSLRLEAKKHGIRVINVHPGGVKTSLYENLPEKPDISSYMDPIKVAEIVVYLSETTDLSPDEIVLSRLNK